MNDGSKELDLALKWVKVLSEQAIFGNLPQPVCIKLDAVVVAGRDAKENPCSETYREFAKHSTLMADKARFHPVREDLVRSILEVTVKAHLSYEAMQRFESK